MNKITILLILIAGFATPSHAQDKNMFNPVNFGVISLNVSTDAKAMGLGGCGIATMPDANSLHCNAAKYVCSEYHAGAVDGGTRWMPKIVNDIFKYSKTGFIRIGENSSISTSFNYFSL